MSITWISLKPESARFFSISHPSPPAPLSTIRWGVDSINPGKDLHNTMIISYCSFTVIRSAYRTLDVSSASMVSDPGTQSSSLKGPGLLKALYKCFLQSKRLVISFPHTVRYTTIVHSKGLWLLQGKAWWEMSRYKVCKVDVCLPGEFAGQWSVFRLWCESLTIWLE